MESCTNHDFELHSPVDSQFAGHKSHVTGQSHNFVVIVHSSRVTVKSKDTRHKLRQEILVKGNESQVTSNFEVTGLRSQSQAKHVVISHDSIVRL